MGRSAITDSKHSEASMMVFIMGIMVAAAVDGKRSLETWAPEGTARPVCLATAGEDAASALFAFAAMGASFLFREDTGVAFCEDGGMGAGEMAAGAGAVAAADAAFLAPLCCVIRIVFFPPLVAGSFEICLMRVWMRVFWSMSFGQTIIYCCVCPSSPVTEYMTCCLSGSTWMT